MQPPSLRTYLWIAGNAFILVASLSFVAYLRFHLPWWTMVLALGLSVGAVVMGLEHVIAGPIEKLARGPGRAKDGMPLAPPAPAERFAASDARRLWRGMRAFQEHAAQLRSAQAGVEARVERADREARLMRAAANALRPDAALAEEAPALLRDLAELLGVPAVWLVPLRRHCPVPVTGPDGPADWGEELRASGIAPWEELLGQDRPLAMCLTDRAPYWRRHFAHETLWIFPLVYHKRAQGFLLARPEGAERTWTEAETALVEGLAPILAAALHPPRWSEVRRKGEKGGEEPEAEAEAAIAGPQALEAPLAEAPAAAAADMPEPAPEADPGPPPAASWLVALAGGAEEAADAVPAADEPPVVVPEPSRRQRRRQRAGA